MIDTKLKPLFREVTFWLMLAMSLPGIVSVYVSAIDAVQTGSFDPGAFQSAFLALPIVAYLLTRQYPRGKAVEAAAVQAAAAATPVPPIVLPPGGGLSAQQHDELVQAVGAHYGGVGAGETIDEPDDGFGAVSTGGAHDAVSVEAEKTDAAAVETSNPETPGGVS